MKQIIYTLLALIFISCQNDVPCDCDEPSNGFVKRTGQTISMGSDQSVDVVKKIDNAWVNRDYETLKSLICAYHHCRKLKFTHFPMVSINATLRR